MTRNELIDRLIDVRIDCIYQGGGPEQYLRELFAHGPQGIYGGYENMDDDQLIAEWNIEYGVVYDEMITKLEEEDEE
jgi:hypothetical protein